MAANAAASIAHSDSSDSNISRPTVSLMPPDAAISRRTTSTSAGRPSRNHSARCSASDAIAAARASPGSSSAIASPVPNSLDAARRCSSSSDSASAAGIVPSTIRSAIIAARSFGKLEGVCATHSATGRDGSKAAIKTAIEGRVRSIDVV
ncbi:MAG: hypothetical protein RJA16_1518 [Planctomycetota bacterium]